MHDEANFFIAFFILLAIFSSNVNKLNETANLPANKKTGRLAAQACLRTAGAKIGGMMA